MSKSAKQFLGYLSVYIHKQKKTGEERKKEKKIKQSAHITSPKRSDDTFLPPAAFITAGDAEQQAGSEKSEVATRTVQ